MAETPSRAIRVPQDLWDQLRAHAAAEDRSVTYIILRAIRQYLADAQAPAGSPAPPP